MCFNPLAALMPKAPKLSALPAAPTTQDVSAGYAQRQLLESQKLEGRGGTAATVKTDLAPSSIVGQRRVLLGV